MSASGKVYEVDGPDVSHQFGESMAAQLRTAFNARDIDTLSSLVAEEATWGDDRNGATCCRNREDIISRLKLLLTAGVQATIVQTRIGPGGIAARVEVRWPEAQDSRANRISYAQVYVVRDGLVTQIHGHDDMDSALAAESH
jgi:SnoaL-like domain